MKSWALLLLFAATALAKTCSDTDKSTLASLKKEQTTACGADATAAKMCASSSCLDFFKKAASSAPDCTDADNSNLRNATVTSWLACLQTKSVISTCPQAVISANRQFQASCGPQLPNKDDKPAYCSPDCMLSAKDLMSKADCVANGIKVGEAAQVLMTACGETKTSIAPSTNGPIENLITDLPSTPPSHRVNETTINPNTPPPHVAGGSTAGGSTATGNDEDISAPSAKSSASGSAAVKPVKKSDAASLGRACVGLTVAIVAGWSAL